jgi:hypothetical protein
MTVKRRLVKHNTKKAQLKYKKKQMGGRHGGGVWVRGMGFLYCPEARISPTWFQNESLKMLFVQ